MAKEKTDPSKVEVAKHKSEFLRGTIDETLKDPGAACFGEDDLQLLKFHGTYQQDDRDLRKERRSQGLGKAYSFMIRVALPAGEMNAQQYLAIDKMADDFANGTIRITTRQAIQFHGVLKTELRETMRQINEAMMTTLAACGDVCRNVMATAAPIKDKIHDTVRKTAHEIAADLRPATKAYYELWVDGKKEVTTKTEEPFYGETYLPRKYKVGVTVQGDNQIDIYSYDAGLIGVVEDDEVIGWNIVAGGGLGMSHGRPNTFAQIAEQIGFVALKDGVQAIQNVASIYRDFGNRADRKQARLKYLIDKMGVEEFTTEFKNRCDFDVHPWREIPDVSNEDWLGQHAQGDGKYFYGVFVENGRIKDTESMQLRTAFREIVKQIGCPSTLTAQQSILFNDLTLEQIVELKAILKQYHVPLIEEISLARRHSMACPSMPTCGLAVAESERALPDLMTDIENELKEIGLDQSQMTIRMTGCPNGCARPYTADIALVGRRPGVYHLFVGGRLAGDRMADLYAADVKIEKVIETLHPLLTSFAKHKIGNECLGDYYRRLSGDVEPRKRVTGKELPTMEAIQPKLVQLKAG
ncbi:MAG: NADPH-dependent assimilatory sulfite reductase hemoprotein subunit [Planctomycetota bacterium]